MISSWKSSKDPGAVSIGWSCAQRGERPPTRGAAEAKGTAIMKLTTTGNVSVDGVIQGLGGPADLRDLRRPQVPGSRSGESDI